MERTSPRSKDSTLNYGRSVQQSDVADVVPSTEHPAEGRARHGTKGRVSPPAMGHQGACNREQKGQLDIAPMAF